MKKLVWILLCCVILGLKFPETGFIIGDWIIVNEFSTGSIQKPTNSDTISLCKYGCRQYVNKRQNPLYYSFRSDGTAWYGSGQFNETNEAVVSAAKITEKKLGKWVVDTRIYRLSIKESDTTEIKFQILPSDSGTLMLTVDKRNIK